MFEVSEKASEMIRVFLKGRGEPQFIRVLMDEGGWKGPHLVMATGCAKKRMIRFLWRKG